MRGGLTVERVSGVHDDIVREPLVGLTAQRIAAHLDSRSRSG